MIGTLRNVFEITGRGCVVLVEVESGDCGVGHDFCLGEKSWLIAGIDIPHRNSDALQRMEQGWVPPLALLLKGAEKADLVPEIGNECSTTVAAPS